MQRSVYFSSLFFLLLGIYLPAQTLDKTANQYLVKNFEALSTTQLKENIYIHTDKDIYEPNEDIWFKAYIFNGNTLKLSRSTKIIFVELHKVEKEHTHIITQEKYAANNGFADGHLSLADSLKDGTYQLIIHTKNSLESAQKEIRAVKEFQLKTNIIPKILIDTEFLQKSYNRTHKVTLNTVVFSRNRTPYANISVEATLYAGTKKIDRTRFKTNDKGETTISFPIEKSKKATTIQLRVTKDKHVAEHKVEIPFKNGTKIQFGMYPEGGKLVANLPNTLAFKAVDLQGKPLQVKGKLYENGKRIQTFKAAHFGMGKFSFTPKTNRSYTVKITHPNIDSVFQVPNIVESGIKLQVRQQTKEHVEFNITKTNDITDQKVYIRVQSRGLIYWMAMASLTKQQIQFTVPLHKLPQGIAEVTLFNEDYQPIAERLIYANMDQKLHVSLTEINKDIFQQKEKVTLTFKVQDQFKNPAIANFSMSIHDHLYRNKGNQYAMMPHYYLFSELKGHVHNVDYYFNPKNKQREHHLDLLLLTQGWRNYIWNEANLQHTATINFNPVVHGKAFLKTQSGTLQNATATALQIISPKKVKRIETDSSGLFSIPYEYLANTKGEHIYIGAEKNNAILEIYDHFSKIKTYTKHKQILFPSNDKTSLTTKASSYNNAFSVNGMNYLDKVELIDYKKRQKERHINRIITQYRYPPSGIIDYPGKKEDYICYEYATLNCVNHPAGPPPSDGMRYRLNNGELVIYRAPKDVNTKRKNKNLIAVKGMYTTKSFYNPVYDTADKKVFPDHRKTLFWAPNLVSNQQGEITVSFYTSDVQTTFLGKLEGTNGDGLIGTESFTFKVY